MDKASRSRKRENEIMTEEIETKWQKCKRLAEFGTKEDKEAFENMRMDSANRRKRSYQKSIKENDVYDGRLYNLERKAIPEVKEREKILAAKWYQENKDYKKIYEQQHANKFYYNLSIHKKWVSEGSKLESMLLRIDPKSLPKQRRNYEE